MELGGIILLDGATGTELQKRGLPPGARPELLGLTDPELLTSVHRSYIQAGSRIVYANTFGASPRKLAGTGHTVSEVVSAAVAAAKRAAAGTGALVALDMGPLGELLEPMGTLSFEAACDQFRQIAEAGAAAGADLAAIETMTDLYEAKAALLAVKESTRLPVFVTMTFQTDGRTFTGCTVESMARTLEGLGADAVGMNCSLGPDQLAPLLAELCRCTRLPVIAKPNAGLPDPVTGEYTLGPEEFVRAMLPCLEAGVTILGGCCGTTPEHIRLLARALEGRSPARRTYEAVPFVCTPSVPCRIDRVRTIGERINPTGKKRFQQALLEEDLDYLLEVAVQEEDGGADILDVNVGFPGVDERTLLPKVVRTLQSAVSLPLQLDSSDPEALEAALRVYNGKPAVNSVNGDPAVLERILPLVKKYGASVVGLCLDSGGVPRTAAERVSIARRICDAARAHKIAREDLWIDCLTLTVSAQQEQARETLAALRTVRRELGLRTVLGVSNISFGLPERSLIDRTFLVQALEAGLDLPILNPNRREMMDAVYAFRVLSGQDRECRAYVDRFAAPKAPAAPAAPVSAAPAPSKAMDLESAVIRGLRAESAALAREALAGGESGLRLVEERLIPALDHVGAEYETGRMFLPQLLSAAGAAQSVFAAVRESLARRGGTLETRGRLAVATVKGDIHDIGKNIVKTVLENYGYETIDLGRDVPAETIVRTVEAEGLHLVGLSALMTTTLPAMEETVRRLKSLPEPPVVFVGGAVVTAEYASRIGADHYAKDARQSVEIAKRVLG